MLVPSILSLYARIKNANLRNIQTIKIDYFTAPDGPASINNEDDAEESSRHCKPHLLPILDRYDGFVVACYSLHPLVEWLQEKTAVSEQSKPVWGIFQASVIASLQAIGVDMKYGIVSTGKVWEKLLTDGVNEIRPIEAKFQLAGVETTGLSAAELHQVSPGEVRGKMKDATKRLVGRGDVGAICMGCAGMAGFDEMVREACVEALGKQAGEKVRIVDGTLAAIDTIAVQIQA